MINELAESQKKRYQLIKNKCDEILKLEYSKWDVRIKLDQNNRHITAGLESNSKLDQSEAAKGWAANLGQAKSAKADNESELEKIREQQREAIRKIEGIVNL